MQGVLAGFVTIGALVSLGILLAQVKFLDAASQRLLIRLAFFVASPALMVTVLSDTDVAGIFSVNLVASLGSVAVVSLVWVLLARLVFRRSGADTVIGTFSSAYVNAGNLGLPIAAYALGDASLIAPMLLTQLLVLQPVGMAILDVLTAPVGGGAARIGRLLSRPLRNPLTVGTLIGLLLSVFDLTIPRLIADPLELVAGMAVPAMLLAFGVSLRLGPLPGAGEPAVQVATVVALKLVAQPLCAFAIATGLGLQGPDVFAVTVIAALPTAQNVFTHAVRYQRGVILARDSIFISTILAVPTMIAIAALLA